MNEPTDPHEFIKRSLDMHFERYVAFTRLLLSLAAGSLSLLVALSGEHLVDAHAQWPTALAFALLCVSVLAGVLVQYQIVERPRLDIARLQVLLDQAAESGSSEALLLRKLPTRTEICLFRLQTLSFISSFALLAAAGMIAVWT